MLPPSLWGFVVIDYWLIDWFWSTVGKIAPRGWFPGGSKKWPNTAGQYSIEWNDEKKNKKRNGIRCWRFRLEFPPCGRRPLPLEFRGLWPPVFGAVWGPRRRRSLVLSAAESIRKQIFTVLSRSNGPIRPRPVHYHSTRIWVMEVWPNRSIWSRQYSIWENISCHHLFTSGREGIWIKFLKNWRLLELSHKEQ